jgi:hypothetical protein
MRRSTSQETTVGSCNTFPEIIASATSLVSAMESRAFLHDLGILMQHRSIDEVVFLLGERNFVFIAVMGTVEGEPCVYINLYRVKDEKIVEHWGFPEKIPPEEQWKNNNGML